MGRPAPGPQREIGHPIHLAVAPDLRRWLLTTLVGGLGTLAIAVLWVVVFVDGQDRGMYLVFPELGDQPTRPSPPRRY
jgi:hypothetical protein